MDVDRLRALPGARRHLWEDGRTAQLLGPRLHGQDSPLGCVRSTGTRFRPSRHAVPAAEQNQRHFRMLRGKEELKSKSQDSRGQFYCSMLVKPAEEVSSFVFLRLLLCQWFVSDSIWARGLHRYCSTTFLHLYLVFLRIWRFEIFVFLCENESSCKRDWGVCNKWF